MVLLWVHLALAQGDGLITPLRGEGGLPPGAVHQGDLVLHPITSPQENLHLLAGYYYGNPREWKRIYQENRAIIRNPNRLPIGETLKIQVGETWKPRFSYEEWFRLANRNGQWESGKSWKRARMSSKPMTPTVVKSAPPEVSSPDSKAMPQVTSGTEPAKPSATSIEISPAPPEKAMPQQDEKPVVDDTPKEETPAEEAVAPAF